MEERIIHKLLEHDTRLERIESHMANKIDVSDIMDNQDDSIKALMRIDQEQVYAGNRICRIENNVDQTRVDVTNIKKHLGLK